MNRQAIIESEYKFGVEAEGIVKPLLEKYVGELETTDRFCSFDFKNEDFTIELKTRKNTKDKFYDTIIGECKFKKAEDILKGEPERRIIFVFNFTDGIYFWEYNSNVARAFGERWIRRRDLGPDYKGQNYKLIPVNILKKLEELK